MKENLVCEHCGLPVRWVDSANDPGYKHIVDSSTVRSRWFCRNMKENEGKKGLSRTCCVAPIHPINDLIDLYYNERQ